MDITINFFNSIFNSFCIKLHFLSYSLIYLTSLSYLCSCARIMIDISITKYIVTRKYAFVNIYSRNYEFSGGIYG